MSAMKLGLFIAIIRAFTSVAPMADSSPSRFAGFILPLHHSIRVLTLSLLVAATHGIASGQSRYMGIARGWVFVSLAKEAGR